MSQTKAVTSIAVVQLIEKGKLKPSTPIDEILKEMRELQVLEGFDGEDPILRKPKRMPTIADLLTHTSGFLYDTL